MGHQQSTQDNATSFNSMRHIYSDKQNFEKLFKRKITTHDQKIENGNEKSETQRWAVDTRLHVRVRVRVSKPVRHGSVSVC